MSKAMRILGVIIPALLAASLALPALAAPPVVNVTAATGGSAISNSNIANAIWITLTGPVLTETAPNGIGSGTIVLAAPAGFKFDTAAPVTVTVGLVSGSAAKNLTLTSPNAVVTASTITITVATSSSGTSLGSLTWSGIKVMPTGCSPLATGNITMSASSTSGINLSNPNLGTLTETGSTALTFIQQPSNAMINTVIAPAVTLNACGSGALPTVTAALTTPAGATLSGTLSATTINATGLATFGNLSVNLVGTYTLTATSPGLTSAVSNSFVIYYPTPTTTSISPASANVGATGFTMTVNGTNFVPASVARFNGANRTTTYVSSTQLTVTILMSDLTVAGTFPIDVVNLVISGLGGGTSNPQTFTVWNVLPGRFNTFETSTAAGAIVGNIFTKIAGSAFTLDVVALNLAKTAVLTTFTGAVKVELLNASDNSGALDANNCRSSWTNIQTLAPNPTFVAADNGRKSVSFIENNAWKEVRIRVSYPAIGAATAIGCSTDNFAIRPVAFTITSTNATNTNTSGAPAIKAGSSFNLTATAVAGYDGTPSIDTSQVAGSPTAGTLAGSFGAAPVASGIATGSSFTYTEVGNFGLNANAVYDTSFTSVEQAGDCTVDFSNVLVGGKYGCNIGSNAIAQTTGSSGFGRFIPDHFDTAVVATATVPMPCPTVLTCPTLYNGFIYSGQAFSVQVTARNLADTITQNYDSVRGYSKAVTLSSWDAAGGATANPSGGTLSSNSVLSSSFNLGVSTTSTPVYTFPPTPVAPTDIYVRALDTDNVTSLRGISSVEGGIKVVSGRIKIANAYGSELLALPITATVQYWNGAGYVTSATDSATQFNTNLTAVGDVQATITNGLLVLANVSVVTPGMVTFANGVKTFTLTAPNVAGSVDLAIITAPSYLLPSTTGRATFGVYKGANEFIYLRENY